MTDLNYYQLSQEQQGQYFDRIRMPSSSRIDASTTTSQAPHDRLKSLNLLISYHLRNIPFESISLHYSWHRVINAEAKHVFDKMVTQGRGGYCMEQNTLFNTVLLNLGFEAYMAGARVYNSKPGKFGGFDHCVNIVTVGEQRYLVDVGFGSNGPTAALPMDSGEAETEGFLGQVLMRLRYAPISQALNQKARFWIYERRDQLGHGDWEQMHCFTDTEFLPEDIQIANLKPSTTPTSFFVQKVVAMRFLSLDDGATEERGYLHLDTRDCETILEGEITGILTLNGDIFKVRHNGKTIRTTTLKDEGERIEILEKYFGIRLGEMDREAIKETASETTWT
ncbi:hypothetical protein FZEAL_3573 [Fusarium zealandicum]|uniref:Arylamine N-acetyltransferase n=1 Tax=Fusarium zealandicum TaxID=1053134 RepID=A0A8H4XMF8_9HYPO|nr:hypothetical protein FZEAL_3573 [Fusarium zealandicum]